jgi:hypothetical protein
MLKGTPRPLPRWERFLFKLLRSTLLSGMLIGGSLSLGAAGYHQFEGMPWLDAYLNASMILTGMGPVNVLHTEEGKVFAIAYALFSGVVFLSAAAVLFAPIVHRFLHRFHLDVQASPEDPRQP